MTICVIDKDKLKLYQKNIDYFLSMTKKQKYDKVTKYAIASYEGTEIYMTEFLYAKNRGWVQNLRGHKEILKEYIKFVPYLFCCDLFDEVLENIKDGRNIYVMRMQEHRFFHIVDEESFLISFFVMGDLNFNKQLNKRFRYKYRPKREGGHFSILSPARPFWRHLDLLEQLYHELMKNTIVAKPFKKGESV